MRKGKTFVLTAAMMIIAAGAISSVSADPGNPPPPPPDPPSGYGSDVDRTPWTHFTSCYPSNDNWTELNGNQLEYCPNPYRLTNTTQVGLCDEDGDGEPDPGETKGSFFDPKIDGNCPRGSSATTFSVTKTFHVCGPNAGYNDNNDPMTASKPLQQDDVSEWACPTTSILSERHEPGSLDPGFNVMVSDPPLTQHPRTGNKMDASFNVVIPACVNRIPMIRLNLTMREPSSGEQISSQSAVSAKHKNMYYGTSGTGNLGKINNLDLPDEQESFVENYTVEAELNSYRMWSWRQRFAEAVSHVVENDSDITIPEGANVTQIAEDIKQSGDSGVIDHGKEIGDLWLTRDMLRGTLNPDPASSGTETNIRYFNTSCSQDVTEISEESYSDVDSFRDDVQNNEEGMIDLLGKGSGSNYCDLGSNAEMTEIWNVDSIGDERVYDVRTGSFSTKLLENTTETVKASINTSDLETDTESQPNASAFLDYYQRNTDTARDVIKVNIGDSNITRDTGDWEISVSDIAKISDWNVTVDVDANRWWTASEWNSLWGTDAKEREALQKLNMVSDPDNNTYINDHLGSDYDDPAYPAGLGDPGTPTDPLKPASAFTNGGNAVYLASIEGVGEGDGKYNATVDVNVSYFEGSSTAYIEHQVREEESTGTSWSWRALGEIDMTHMTACMYHWEDCFNQTRELEYADRSGYEIFDAGYGAARYTSFYNASNTSVQKHADFLEENYSVEREVSFDKFYDGARGVDEVSAFNVTVYRSCNTTQSWLSAENKYAAQQFMCQEGSEQILRCAYGASSNFPSEVEKRNVTNATMYQGDWYVCQEGDSGATWQEDTTPPRIQCEDCISPTTAEIGEEIVINASVKDKGSGTASATVCGDADCSEVICDDATTACTYSSNSADQEDIYVRATDRQGNMDTVKIGSVRIAKGIGSYCETDNECLSGRCSSRQCRPQQIAPIIDLEVGDN